MLQYQLFESSSGSSLSVVDEEIDFEEEILKVDENLDNDEFFNVELLHEAICKDFHNFCNWDHEGSDFRLFFHEKFLRFYRKFKKDLEEKLDRTFTHKEARDIAVVSLRSFPKPK